MWNGHLTGFRASSLVWQLRIMWEAESGLRLGVKIPLEEITWISYATNYNSAGERERDRERERERLCYAISERRCLHCIYDNGYTSNGPMWNGHLTGFRASSLVWQLRIMWEAESGLRLGVKIPLEEITWISYATNYNSAGERERDRERERERERGRERKREGGIVEESQTKDGRRWS